MGFESMTSAIPPCCSTNVSRLHSSVGIEQCTGSNSIVALKFFSGIHVKKQ